MVNQNQIPQQQDLHDQPERHASLIPFAPVEQVGFNLKDTIFNPNNEIVLLYLEHSNKKDFKCVSNFISKCCLWVAFTRYLNQYKKYLSEFFYFAKALKNSKVFFSTLTSDKHVIFEAPKTSSKAKKKDSKGKKPRATTRFSKIQTGSKSKATKDGSSKVPNGFQSGHFKIVYSSASDTNPSQPPTSIPVDVGMRKEDQQAAGGPTSLRVISEEGGHPQLSSGMSTSNLNKPIFLASFIIHSESASGRDASTDSTAEADPRKYTPNDSIPQQQGMNERAKNYSFGHIFVDTDPNVLTDKTNSVSQGSKTILTTPEIGKGASTIAKQPEEVNFDNTKVFKEIKLEDLSKLVQNA
uniref:Uncharacterized protein n=1 Tax=Tanacetum cinerariifolium TaxID=118510 RepID=A0A6L2NT16_TANCI|nr:hypothetical protein [Tanacetum cinerariifolium]